MLPKLPHLPLPNMRKRKPSWRADRIRGFVAGSGVFPSHFQLVSCIGVQERCRHAGYIDSVVNTEIEIGRAHV